MGEEKHLTIKKKARISDVRIPLMNPIKPTPTDRSKKFFQQACDTENMPAKWGQTLLPEENEVRRFILVQAPVLGRLPSITEVKQNFTQLSDNRITTILTKLDKLDVIHLSNNQTIIAAAYPFSGSATPHVVTLKRESYKPLYAMCAIDALGISFMLNCDVVIDSNCYHFNDRIEIVIENHEITSLVPEELVVWGDMDYSNCAASSVCQNTNFFSSIWHFNKWQEELPKRRGFLLQIQEAFFLGKMFFEKRLMY
ncbi:MAG: alkylmercury lyase family protein [Candidatus Hodarchaeales archaeon]